MTPAFPTVHETVTVGCAVVFRAVLSNFQESSNDNSVGSLWHWDESEHNSWKKWGCHLPQRLLPPDVRCLATVLCIRVSTVPKWRVFRGGNAVFHENYTLTISRLRSVACLRAKRYWLCSKLCLKRSTDLLFISVPRERIAWTQRMIVLRVGTAWFWCMLDRRRKSRWTAVTDSLFIMKLL